MIPLEKLPDDLLIMIINLSSFKCSDCKHNPPYKYHSFNISFCNICKKPLCSKHTKQAKKWGEFYECQEYECLMCDYCCWT